MTTQQQMAPVARRHSLHWTVFVGLTLLCMLVGFLVFSALATWWQHTEDSWRYGMPRTFQMDAVVGHQDSAAHPSHFIALNLDGHLSVIEMQGGDVSKTVIYAGPILYGQDADLVAVTLSLAHDGQGKPELVLHYQNNEVILSDGKDGKFHLQQPPQSCHLCDPFAHSCPTAGGWSRLLLWGYTRKREEGSTHDAPVRPASTRVQRTDHRTATPRDRRHGHDCG